MVKDNSKELYVDSRIKYLLVGMSSVGIEYISFLLINFITNRVVLSNITSFALGFMYSFWLHKHWSFKGNQKHRTRHQLLGYAALAAINVTLTSFIIYTLTHRFNIAPSLAKLVCMILVVTWNYILMNKIIFGKTNPQNEHPTK